MKTKYFLIAILAIISSYVIYAGYFFVFLDYKLSSDTGVWGQFGDFIGGTINPVLSFLSVVLLIKSLNLQHDSNCQLRSEIENNKKYDRIRAFEGLFFNLVERQKSIFESFSIVFLINDKKSINYSGSKAVVEIEDVIKVMRIENKTDFQISEKISELDDMNYDKIFELIRAFYVSVVLIAERLSDDFGFVAEDRKLQIKALINLTEFSQIRAIIICIQFLDCEPARYLKLSSEFREVAHDLGLELNLY